ncbi:MAG: hypothetical protein AAGD28_13420 [Bacteroidota bacterium]
MKSFRTYIARFYYKYLGIMPEDDLLETIEHHGGKIFADELAAGSYLSPSQAERKLQKLYARGILEKHFDYERGVPSYSLK